MRIKHVLMMVGLTLVMVVLGLSVGREGSSVVEAFGTKSMTCPAYRDGKCVGNAACINADEILHSGDCSFSCLTHVGDGHAINSTVSCAEKAKFPQPGGGGGGIAWSGGGPPAWSDCYYQAVCDANGTMCF